MVLSAIVGLVFAIGCSASNEKHQITDFLQDYSKTFDEYSDALQKADMVKKNEIEGKLKTYESKWSDIKMEMADRITPQALDEFEIEYQKIAKKYKGLTEKS